MKEFWVGIPDEMMEALVKKYGSILKDAGVLFRFLEDAVDATHILSSTMRPAEVVGMECTCPRCRRELKRLTMTLIAKCLNGKTATLKIGDEIDLNMLLTEEESVKLEVDDNLAHVLKLAIVPLNDMNPRKEIKLVLEIKR
jgi:hypothetical protein